MNFTLKLNDDKSKDNKIFNMEDFNNDNSRNH